MDYDMGLTDRYIKVEKDPLSAGTYGKVYKCRDKYTNELVALKVIEENQNNGLSTTTLREVIHLRTLADFQHPNIVNIFDVIVDGPQKNYCYLVFELKQTDLRKYIELNGPLSNGVIRSFSKQIMKGLEFCHSLGIMHRDIKPANILVSGDCVKIADFGLSRTYNTQNRSYTISVVTPFYKALELLLGYDRYGPSIDIWSVGCVIAEMSLGQPLFRPMVRPNTPSCRITQFDEIFSIITKIGSPNYRATPDSEPISALKWDEVTQFPFYNEMFPQFYPKKFEDLTPDLEVSGRRLLEKIFVYQPSKRITAKQALKEPFLMESNIITEVDILDTKSECKSDVSLEIESNENENEQSELENKDKFSAIIPSKKSITITPEDEISNLTEVKKDIEIGEKRKLDDYLQENALCAA